jgi:transcriptional regulator
MYVPPPFKPDPSESASFLAARGFGTLVAFDGDRPIAAHVPFLYSVPPAEGEIALHVARQNPIHEAILAHPRVLLACLGPDAYISPDWYASENQVPTWNYVAVHVTGRARPMPKEDLRDHVDRLSAQFEERLPKKPWTSGKMDPRRLSAMLNGIVGLVIDVETIEGQWKLGQHKGRADHEGAAAGLRGRREAGAAAVADLMDAARQDRP